MSCYACTKKYGFFTKESGCPNCGYSFCVKCLKKEIEVPKLNNQKCKVCLRCFEKLDKDKQKNQLISENSELKSVDNEIFSIKDQIEAPILEPIHTGEEALSQLTNTDDNDDIKQNLDKEIRKRFDDLKNPMPEGVDTDIAKRLASLKDTEFKEYNNKDILISKDTRNDQEKIQDLLKQFVEENNLEKKVFHDPISDIERRLLALRGQDISSSSTSSNVPKDESLNVGKIIKRYLEEAKLPEHPSPEEENVNVPSDPGLEELPYCVICNEDAVKRCLGCDNDLYCNSCFKEIHNNDEEYRAHKTKNYSIPPKFKENHF